MTFSGRLHLTSAWLSSSLSCFTLPDLIGRQALPLAATNLTRPITVQIHTGLTESIQTPGMSLTIFRPDRLDESILYLLRIS